MPYRTVTGGFERASSLGHVPTVGHPLVQETLGRYTMPAERTKDVAAITESLINPSKLAQSTGNVRWTIATDSSPFEAEVDPHFPSTRVLFTQMAAVIVDLEKMRERQGPFADPVAIREAQRADVIAGVLPSSNLLRSDGTPPRRAFREEVFHLFARSSIEGRSLLDVLLEVEAERDDISTPPGALVMHRCPNPICDIVLDDRSTHFVPVGANGSACPSCQEPLMATDALRAHEAFNEQGANLEACSRVLSVAERLILLTLLGHLQQRRPSAMGQMAFITDGPLALFGEVAPIKRPLLRRLQSLAHKQAQRGFGTPVVVGLEKSGQFAEHAHAICRHIPEGRLMVLTEDYIGRYITHRDSTAHGADTYYGRHFFYRAHNGCIFTVTVPPLGRVGAIPTDAFRLDDYPTLRATCEVLDRIGTRLYEDATIPVALAHQWCAYPLAAAGHVLKLHAEEHLEKATA